MTRPVCAEVAALSTPSRSRTSPQTICADRHHRRRLRRAVPDASAMRPPRSQLARKVKGSCRAMAPTRVSQATAAIACSWGGAGARSLDRPLGGRWRARHNLPSSTGAASMRAGRRCRAGAGIGLGFAMRGRHPGPAPPPAPRALQAMSPRTAMSPDARRAGRGRSVARPICRKKSGCGRILTKVVAPRWRWAWRRGEPCSTTAGRVAARLPANMRLRGGTAMVIARARVTAAAGDIAPPQDGSYPGLGLVSRSLAERGGAISQGSAWLRPAVDAAASPLPEAHQSGRSRHGGCSGNC